MMFLIAGTYNLGVAYADFNTGLANYTFSVWEGTAVAGTSASISNVPEPSTFLSYLYQSYIARQIEKKDLYCYEWFILQ